MRSQLIVYHFTFGPDWEEGCKYALSGPTISMVSRSISIRGEVFHTYSCYSRGVDMLNGAYHYLDLVPKGRDEDGLKFSMEWVRRHDQY